MIMKNKLEKKKKIKIRDDFKLEYFSSFLNGFGQNSSFVFSREVSCTIDCVVASIKILKP